MHNKVCTRNNALQRVLNKECTARFAHVCEVIFLNASVRLVGGWWGKGLATFTFGGIAHPPSSFERNDGLHMYANVGLVNMKKKKD